MKELVKIPSDGWTLHGIVHLPEREPERRVGVVLIVGPNTKFGTHRLFLQLADELARAGFYVLRYDGRGTWDSDGICELTLAARVADARAAIRFFRGRYGLEAMVSWGLCLGAVVALHQAAGASAFEELVDGLVLCNPLLRYSSDVASAARTVFASENPLRKLWKLLRTRENWTSKLPALFQRYVLQRETPTDQLGTAVRKVGNLLKRYPGPMLMIFGENDPNLVVFRKEINPEDCLGLAKKKNPPAWAFVADGDHTFASRKQTAEVLRFTLDWTRPFLVGQALRAQSEISHEALDEAGAKEFAGILEAPRRGQVHK